MGTLAAAPRPILEPPAAVGLVRFGPLARAYLDKQILPGYGICRVAGGGSTNDNINPIVCHV